MKTLTESCHYFVLFLLQGELGRPGIPGLPGEKGDRVSATSAFVT